MPAPALTPCGLWAVKLVAMAGVGWECKGRTGLPHGQDHARAGRGLQSRAWVHGAEGTLWSSGTRWLGSALIQLASRVVGW
jgi:hypothetical protein